MLKYDMNRPPVLIFELENAFNAERVHKAFCLGTEDECNKLICISSDRWLGRNGWPMSTDRCRPLEIPISIFQISQRSMWLIENKFTDCLPADSAIAVGYCQSGRAWRISQKPIAFFNLVVDSMGCRWHCFQSQQFRKVLDTILWRSINLPASPQPLHADEDADDDISFHTPSPDTIYVHSHST